MVHWTTAAYESLGPAGDPIAMQVSFPQLGFTYPYLLRGILAFSAFHLAHIKPAQRQKYRLLAMSHQNLAARGIREALADQITASNCGALYLASTFLVVTKFAAFPDCDDYQVHGCVAPLQSLIEVFSVCTGMDIILRMFWDDINRGPLSFMFGEDSDVTGPPATVLPLLQAQLPSLRASIEADDSASAAGATVISAVDAMIACATEILRRPHSHAPAEMLVLFAWPMLIPRSFLELLQSRHHLALAVLAHYCVLIHWAETRLWCFERWLQPLLKEIRLELESTASVSLLEWPLSVIGTGP